MTLNKVTAQILDLLKQNNAWFETFEHEPVRTSEEAAKIRKGYTLEQGAKALITKIKIPNSENKFIMLVIPGNLKFEGNKVKKLLGAKDIRFATEDEVLKITDGVQPGGVPPFGELFNLEVIADPILLENEKIIFNAGDRGFSIGMLAANYIKIVNPRVESIV
uniref:YbaK/aminoacyl-tRNA synthetase-associated domain-containing protein n=1 Tax=candidate division WWE3 bacterium TaxID=2053526 RepID=A0A7C4XHR1_UNCKA